MKDGKIFLDLEAAVYEACFLLKAMEAGSPDNDFDRRGYINLSCEVRGKLMEAYNALLEAQEGKH